MIHILWQKVDTHDMNAEWHLVFALKEQLVSNFFNILEPREVF